MWLCTEFMSLLPRGEGGSDAIEFPYPTFDMGCMARYCAIDHTCHLLSQAVRRELTGEKAGAHVEFTVAKTSHL